MEAILSWLASCVVPESTRHYRGTWRPRVLRILAAICPCVVWGRIESRIIDLENGGDGFGVPYCPLNGRCCVGATQIFCCCCFCCGWEENLCLQRDMAWVFASVDEEPPAPEYITARWRPWRHLAETETYFHAGLASDNIPLLPITERYTSESPMTSERPYTLHPGNSEPHSRRTGTRYSAYTPIALGPPGGSLVIFPGDQGDERSAAESARGAIARQEWRARRREALQGRSYFSGLLPF